MAIRVTHKVVVNVGLDTGLKDRILTTDDTLAEVILDGFDRGVSNVFSVNAAASETLSTGDLTTIRGLYLKVSGDCVVRLNGSTDDIQMKVGASGGTAKLFLEATITQVEVEAGASAVTGVYCLWGDPTP